VYRVVNLHQISPVIPSKHGNFAGVKHACFATLYRNIVVKIVLSQCCVFNSAGVSFSGSEYRFICPSTEPIFVVSLAYVAIVLV